MKEPYNNVEQKRTFASIISKDWITFLLIIIVFYSILHISGIGCPIKYVTGIPCAGCGMSRALYYVLKLDFRGAFHYHPLFSLPFVVIGLFIFREKLSKKQFDACIFIIISLFIAVYVFRLLDPNDNIVRINVNHGLIGRTLNLIKEGFR